MALQGDGYSLGLGSDANAGALNSRSNQKRTPLRS